MKHAEQQPREGDLVIHCGHLDAPEHRAFSWDKFPKSWVLVCVACWRGALGDPKKVRLAGHGVWSGDASVMVEIRGDA